MLLAACHSDGAGWGLINFVLVVCHVAIIHGGGLMGGRCIIDPNNRLPAVQCVSHF